MASFFCHTRDPWCHTIKLLVPVLFFFLFLLFFFLFLIIFSVNKLWRNLILILILIFIYRNRKSARKSIPDQWQREETNGTTGRGGCGRQSIREGLRPRQRVSGCKSFFLFFFLSFNKIKLRYSCYNIVTFFWLLQFNFVGRILGPRGMTAKQLEQETGCKIMVRGRGSMRDKKKVINLCHSAVCVCTRCLLSLRE